MSEQTVAVFGTGPAGMAAGWAALRAGLKVHYFTENLEKSVLYGCQYLHAPIPLPPDRARKIRHTRVKYITYGTPQQYRAKVYGAKWGGSVSPEDLEGEHHAWDIRAAYDELWSLITRHKRVTVTPVRISHNWIATHLNQLSSFSHIISTIPAPAICENPSYFPRSNGSCFFSSHEIMAAGSRVPEDDPDTGEVVCDGTSEALWYRTACVFGYRTVEWPAHTKGIPVAARAVTVRKPLLSDCRCHPEIIRLGRYGAWRKGVLVHHVFEDAEKLLAGSWVNQQW